VTGVQEKSCRIVPAANVGRIPFGLGLDRIDHDAKYVAVHDAARPLITPEQIERAFSAVPRSLAQPLWRSQSTTR
jgi:hypothetical protein